MHPGPRVSRPPGLFCSIRLLSKSTCFSADSTEAVDMCILDHGCGLCVWGPPFGQPAFSTPLDFDALEWHCMWHACTPVVAMPNHACSTSLRPANPLPQRRAPDLCVLLFFQTTHPHPCLHACHTQLPSAAAACT